MGASIPALTCLPKGAALVGRAGRSADSYDLASSCRRLTMNSHDPRAPVRHAVTATNRHTARPEIACRFAGT